MRISKKNSEGYIDMTAYEAISSVVKAEKSRKSVYRPLVYIASLFDGDIEHNTTNAKNYCRFAVSRGTVPLAPQLLYPQFMDDNDKEQRKLRNRFALILLSKCDELWVFGSQINDDMRTEISKAKNQGMRIKYWNKNCEEVWF